MLLCGKLYSFNTYQTIFIKDNTHERELDFESFLYEVWSDENKCIQNQKNDLKLRKFIANRKTLSFVKKYFFGKKYSL